MTSIINHKRLFLPVALLALLVAGAFFVFGGSRTVQAKPGGPEADISQCRNGDLAADGTDSPHPGVRYEEATGPRGWANGNAGPAHAHWPKGGSIVYRIEMEAIRSGTHTIEIGYDTVHGGVHAIDFLTAAKCTEHDVNPCSGTAFADCFLTGPATSSGGGSFYPFTTDLDGPAGDPILDLVCSNQTGFGGGSSVPCEPYNDLGTAGELNMFVIGGSINSMRYTQQETTGQDQETRVLIDFDADDGAVILSWGGHIAHRVDWGFDGNGVPLSAGGINGSPYHMRLIELCLGTTDCEGGYQDRSLQAAAIFVPPPTVSGIKYHDQDGSGGRNSEPGLPDWEIRAYLDPNGDGILSQTEFNTGASVTGATVGTTGSFVLELAPDTDYVLCEVLQSGWGQTEPNQGADSGVTLQATLSSTGSSVDVQGSLSLLAINQKIKIDSEQIKMTATPADPLTGLTRGVDGTAAAEHTGNPAISILRCGIDDSLGPDGYAIAGAETGDTSGNVFGNFQHNTKSGYKYEDLDADGTDNGSTDPAETSGWVIKLFNDNDNSKALSTGDTLKATTTTGAGATYSFPGLMVDDYIVCEVLKPPGWEQTDPTGTKCDFDALDADLADGGYAFSVTLSGDTSHTGNDFGNTHLYTKIVITCDQTNNRLVQSQVREGTSSPVPFTVGATGLTALISGTGIQVGSSTILTADLPVFETFLCTRLSAGFAQFTGQTAGDYALSVELPNVSGTPPTIP